MMRTKIVVFEIIFSKSTSLSFCYVWNEYMRTKIVLCIRDYKVAS